jgi:hypothetical protein
MTGGYVKTYAVDVNTSHTPEEGAHSPSWPNGLIIIHRHHRHHHRHHYHYHQYHHHQANDATTRQVDNNPYLPIFSFGMVIWATLFTISWQRKSNEWAFKWGTFFKEATEEVRVTRPPSYNSPNTLRFIALLASA